MDASDPAGPHPSAAKNSDDDWEDVPSESEEDTITARKMTKICLRKAPATTPIPMPEPGETGELPDEDNFLNIGLPPWEAQKLRNKEERKVIAKVMQDHIQEAIADLQRGEEAAQEPEPNTEAPTAAAQPEAKDEGPRYKTTICRNWQQGYCKGGDQCGFAHGDEELRQPPVCKY